MHAVLERALRRAARRRPAAPARPRSSAWIGARPRAGRRGRRRAGARRAPGRAGDAGAASNGCSRASSARRRERDARRLRALAARGRGSPTPRRPSEPALEIDGWRLHGAIDRVDRAADGRALVLDYKVSSKVSAREEARGGGEAAAAALPDRGRRALGGGAGRRPLPPAARHLGAPAPRARPRGRGGRPGRATGLSAPTSSPREEFEALLAEARAPGRRDRRPDARRARSAATRGRGPACATTTICPRVLRLRADLPPRPGAGRADERRGARRSGERARRRPTEQAAAIEAERAPR